MRLFKRLIIIARYFFFGKSLRNNVKKHQKLKRKLKPFITNKLISAYTPYIYLRKYISNSIPVSKSFEILNHHYSFLKKTFSDKQLQHLFYDGIVCYTEENYKILLTGSKDQEREGSLSLLFLDNEINIATLSFTFSSGETFGMHDENIIIVSRLQKINAHLDKIRAAKKHFRDIMPTVVLFSLLESISVTLNIKNILGIHGKDQLSYKTSHDYSYTLHYDEFWLHNGGTMVNDGYIMSCPIPKKNILLIKQTHRNRARKKRERLEAIYYCCYSIITKALITKILLIKYAIIAYCNMVN